MNILFKETTTLLLSISMNKSFIVYINIAGTFDPKAQPTHIVYTGLGTSSLVHLTQLYNTTNTHWEDLRMLSTSYFIVNPSSL